MKVSVVMPAYNEEDGVGATAKDFRALGFVDEIIVVDNNSTDATAAVAEGAGAKVVKEEKQGYGNACIRALKEAKSDIVVLVESDGTFSAADLIGMLDALEEADFVSGSRTFPAMNESGADMSWYKVAGNRILGKLVSWLYGCEPLTDIGSTFVAVRRKSLERFVDKLHIGDSSFSSEMYVAAASSGAITAQMPVRYRHRIGKSKLSSGHLSSLKIGFKHLKHVFALRKIYPKAGRPSFYYRHPFVFRAISKLMYAGSYLEKFRKASDVLEEGASALDVCCADATLFDIAKGKRIKYAGVDVNARFVRLAKKKGIDARRMNVETADALPEADYVVMLSSLYQFIPRHEEIIDKMVAAARKKVVVSEPVKNLASSRNRIIASAAGRLSDPGTGIKTHRFDENALKEMIKDRSVTDSGIICGGKEFFFVIDAAAEKARASRKALSDNADSRFDA